MQKELAGPVCYVSAPLLPCACQHREQKAAGPYGRKLRDAQESLQGEQGRGRLVGLHRELVARRCLLVCQLGHIFQLGSMTGAGRIGHRHCAALAASLWLQCWVCARVSRCSPTRQYAPY
jgi:hypothetical protein